MSKTPFSLPKPNATIMKASGYLSEWCLLQGLPILRDIPLLRDIPPCGGYFKVSSISLPDADRIRLQEATSPHNAFFLGPNHPEFTTDWLIDKYISSRFAPQMSSWAASSIIRGPLSYFWSANNLIGNDGGDAAKEYSIACALRGHGTLLHPEGSVRWRSDKIFDLLPGIVDMAISAAKRLRIEGLPRKALIVPIVWKVVYDGVVASRLSIGLEKLERSLKLPGLPEAPLGPRYVRFHQHLLAKQMRRFGETNISSWPSIEDAERFFGRLLQELLQRYAVDGTADDTHRVLHRLYRKAREAKNRNDCDAIVELQRLAAYSKETFRKDFFYQEEIADGLQFIRQTFLTGGYDSVRSMLPKPFGWRTVHIRVPELIDVSARLGSAADEATLSKALLGELKSSMDEALGCLNRLFEGRLQIPNR